MVGLLNQQPQGGMPQPGGGAPPQGGPMQRQQPMDDQAEGGESNVTPEEQQEYETFVSNGMQLIYNEQAMPQLLETIEGDGNPIEGIANALVSVVLRLDDSAREQGREISGDVKYHGATELMEQMIELAEEAGVHEYSEEDMESAFFLALDIYRTTRQQQGLLPEEELQQEMQELMAAEQQDRIDEVLPGVSEYAQRAPNPEELQQQMGGAGPGMGRRG